MGAVILDTRKTTPGLRALEKHAVRCGGADHRAGLYDQHLVKDNHIRAAGSLTQAVERIRAVRDAALLLEVEAATLDQVREASAPRSIVPLDNMIRPWARRSRSSTPRAPARPYPRPPAGRRRWPQIESGRAHARDRAADGRASA
jgi:nicotinate-nucleotide pyrophosphorylase